MTKIERVPYRHKLPVMRKYNFGDMAVDDRMTIEAEDGEPVATLSARVRAPLGMWKRRSGNSWWRHHVTQDTSCVYVYRLPDMASEDK